MIDNMNTHHNPGALEPHAAKNPSDPCHDESMQLQRKPSLPQGGHQLWRHMAQKSRESPPPQSY
eukprot:1152015-Pelagomonas_calceolata.AAC.15